jgi:dTDP-4-amino-4,6-dideoxygalactose transaminase
VVAPSRQQRDAAAAALRSARIQTSIHYPPVTRFRAYADTVADVPLTEEFAERTLSLPMHSRLTDGDVDEICDALAEHIGVSGAAG